LYFWKFFSLRPAMDRLHSLMKAFRVLQQEWPTGGTASLFKPLQPAQQTAMLLEL